MALVSSLTTFLDNIGPNETSICATPPYGIKSNSCIIPIGSLMCMSHVPPRLRPCSMSLYTGLLRGLIADYGVPLLVVVWTAASYIPAGNVPEGIPRRLLSPNPWSPGAYSNWTVMKACFFLNTEAVYVASSLL